MLWHAKSGTYHCRSPACCKTRCRSCSRSCPLSAPEGDLCRPGSASLWGPSRPSRTHGRLQANRKIGEQSTVKRTGHSFSCKGFRICREDVGSFIPKLLCTYVCHRRTSPTPQKNYFCWPEVQFQLIIAKKIGTGNWRLLNTGNHREANHNILDKDGLTRPDGLPQLILTTTQQSSMG